MELNKIYLGDCLTTIKTFPDNCIDSIVTDPPYELGFMGKSWDSTGIANNVEMWAECLRVLKPGGHLLSFSGTRTYHRMASAIEDAGFEVRDMIEWIYGSGFPKSLNIGKAVDKLQGNEREITGSEQKAKPTFHSQNVGGEITEIDNIQITKGISEWEGRGTALKPAHEPICLARKPLAEKTVAENCLKWGTGGINIDESRVGTEIITQRLATVEGGKAIGGKGVGIKQKATGETTTTIGRFPANLIHDNSEEVRECFPDTHGALNKKDSNIQASPSFGIGGIGKRNPAIIGDNGGSASRFFKSILYYPKASKGERNKGCEELEEKKYGTNITPKEGSILKYGYEEAKRIMEEKCVNQNNHPTVKPIALMEYLIKMVTKEGGIVLDPFAGSGTTLVAAKKNGYQYIGCELTEEYIPIIEARLNATDEETEEEGPKEISLFN